MNERTYRGVVATVSPLAITLPSLSGSVLFEPCEQVGSASLSIGDEVLAIRTDGREGDADLWWVVPAQTQGPEGMFVGQIVPHALAAAPALWLPCDGTTRLRADFADLFAAISTQYNTGGEPGTEFRLPNLKGRVPVGLDTGQPEFDVRGETGGAKTHTLTVGQIPAHTHSLLLGWGAGSNFRAQAGAALADFGTTGTIYNTLETNGSAPAGGNGQAHNNLQPYLTLNYAIYAGA